jgi:ABC-type transporter Mla maintaining outer membrane lipid asymmetry permease subunit MlaE
MKAPFLAAALLAGVSRFASATAIVVGTGWQNDQIDAAETVSLNSACTFSGGGVGHGGLPGR